MANQVQMMVDSETNCASKSNEEYQRWEENRSRLFASFSNPASTSNLATEAVAHSLIDAATFERATDTTRFTEDERAGKLVMYIYKQVKMKPIFETFLQNLDSTYFKSVRESLSKTL